jgi:uncharacterized membrane protein
MFRNFFLQETMMIPIQHIHPMIVHFPIVLIILLAAVDTFASFSGKSVTGRTVAGNLSVSLSLLVGVFAIAAYIFGGMALTIAESGGFHSDVAERHESLGELVAIVTSVYAVLRSGLWLKDVRLSGPWSFFMPVAGIAGCALVAATAYFGGQLVYELGVNVAKVAVN